MDAAQAGDDHADFVFGKYRGDTFAFLRAEGGKGGFVEGNREDVAIEKEDGAERLVLGGFGDFSFDDKVGDELVDFTNGHLAGVDSDLSAIEVGVMVVDIFANPVEVGFFGARGVLFDAKLVTVLVEEFFGCHQRLPSLVNYAILPKIGLGYFTCFAMREAFFLKYPENPDSKSVGKGEG